MEHPYYGHLWAKICGCNREVAALQRCKCMKLYHSELGCIKEVAALQSDLYKEVPLY